MPNALPPSLENVLLLAAAGSEVHPGVLAARAAANLTAKTAEAILTESTDPLEGFVLDPVGPHPLQAEIEAMAARQQQRFHNNRTRSQRVDAFLARRGRSTRTGGL